jgi:hypothetical protein
LNTQLLEMRREFTRRLEARVAAAESAFRHRDLDALEHTVYRLGAEADAAGFMDLREECAALIDALRAEARRARQAALDRDDPDEWISAVDWIAISARVEDVRGKANSILSESSD